jgi:hypothetical protein
MIYVLMSHECSHRTMLKYENVAQRQHITKIVLPMCECALCSREYISVLQTSKKKNRSIPRKGLNNGFLSAKQTALASLAC